MAHAADAPPAQPSQSFDILEYRVLHNTLLPPTVVERAVYPHLGPGKTLEDAQAACAELERAYRDAGYSTVYCDIPVQSVDSGIVRLSVLEGKLDRVHVTGARYFANGAIRSELPSAAPGEVPHFPDLQSDLARANQVSRDLQVTPVLRAGRTPGTVDLDLKVNDTLPLHGSVETNDRYTADTSRTRVSVNLSYDNLWQKYHSLSLQYQTAPQQRSDARVLAATYVMPLFSPGTTLALYAVDTNSDVAAVGTLSVLGKGKIYGARVSEPLPAMGDLFHSFNFGADYKDFSENVLLSEEEGLSTPISYLNWTAGYSGILRAERHSTTFGLAANFGIRGVGNSAEEFEGKRFKGRPNYFYIRADLAHERALFGPLSLSGRFSGQYTVEPVVSNEQFSIGGMDTVRGYLEAEQLGDYGATGSLELRASLIPTGWRDHVQSFYTLVFFDAGVVGALLPLPGQSSRDDLQSWGVGFRFAGLGGLSAALDWAYPLVDGGRTRTGDSRIHFSVRYGF
jgi:hemolysin activation/secretion protein